MSRLFSRLPGTRRPHPCRGAWGGAAAQSPAEITAAANKEGHLIWYAAMRDDPCRQARRPVPQDLSRDQARDHPPDLGARSPRAIVTEQRGPALQCRHRLGLVRLDLADQFREAAAALPAA